MINTDGTVKAPEELPVENSEQKAEAKYNNLKKKLWYAAGVLLTFVVFEVATNTDLMGGTKNTFNEAATISTTQQETIPKEAQNFVIGSGNRYADPVSTYYAEISYAKNNNNIGSIITDEDIEAGKVTTDRTIGENSEIGFTEYELPIDAKMDQETSLKIFNEYTSKNLSRYMNLLARNPSKEAQIVIDKQFENYCSSALGDNLPATAFPLDDTKIESLMDTAKSVVAKYGSNANYTVTPATTRRANPNSSSTLFTSTESSNEIYDWSDTKIQTIHELGVKIVIDVEVFNGKNVTSKQEVLKDIQLSIMRQPTVAKSRTGSPYTYISIGKW